MGRVRFDRTYRTLSERLAGIAHARGWNKNQCHRKKGAGMVPRLCPQGPKRKVVAFSTIGLVPVPYYPSHGSPRLGHKS